MSQLSRSFIVALLMCLTGVAFAGSPGLKIIGQSKYWVKPYTQLFNDPNDDGWECINPDAGQACVVCALGETPSGAKTVLKQVVETWRGDYHFAYVLNDVKSSSILPSTDAKFKTVSSEACGIVSVR